MKKKKGATKKPPPPLFREAAPPGYVLVERHLRKRPRRSKRKR